MITLFYIFIGIFFLLVAIGTFNRWRDNRWQCAHEAYKKKYLEHIKDLGLIPENLCGSTYDDVTMFPNQEKNEITILVRGGWVQKDQIKIANFHADICSVFWGDISEKKCAIDFRQRKLLDACISKENDALEIKYYDITDAVRNKNLEQISCDPVFSFSNKNVKLIVDPLYGTVWCRNYNSYGISRRGLFHDYRLRWKNNCAEQGIGYNYEAPTLICLDYTSSRNSSLSHCFILNDDISRCYRIIKIDGSNQDLFEVGYNDLVSVSPIKLTKNDVKQQHIQLERSHYKIFLYSGVQLSVKNQSNMKLTVDIISFSSIYKELQNFFRSHSPNVTFLNDI